MLPSAPPHLRRDIDYAPGYDSRVRHGGQRRIVEDLARHYDLKLITDWPMPALGVDCFVLEAPSPRGHRAGLSTRSRAMRV